MASYLTIGNIAPTRELSFKTMEGIKQKSFGRKSNTVRKKMVVVSSQLYVKFGATSKIPDKSAFKKLHKTKETKGHSD